MEATMKINKHNYKDIFLLTDKVNDAANPNLTKSTLSRVLHKQSNSSKFNLALLLFILLFSAASMWLVQEEAMKDTSVQTGIAKEILRFHVIANSDSEEDQALKLKVKDKLVDRMSPLLAEAANLSEVKSIVTEQLANLEEIAEDTLQEYGHSYPVSVALEESYFPLKVYGAYTFPPGYYQALRVKIGKAEGKNWWCVMFPPLCFVDETYSIVDENSKEKLLSLLTEEEYETLVSKETPVKIKFKLWEAIKELFDKR
jgi:stage II sporulation protein R